MFCDKIRKEEKGTVTFLRGMQRAKIFINDLDSHPYPLLY